MEHNAGKKWETPVCVAVLLVIAVAMHADLFLNNTVPFKLQSILFMPPWEAARPPEAVEPASPFERIQAARYFPWYAFLHRTVHSGESLLWNPDEGLGIPFLALWRTRVFSLFSLPLYATDLLTGLRWAAILKACVAGVGAFAFARRLGLAPFAALLTGVIFQVSTPFLVWNPHPIADALAWFPLFAWALTNLGAGRLRHWVSVAIALALVLSGGDPEFSTTAVAFGLIFLCIAAWHKRDFVLFPYLLGAFVLAVVLAWALLAVQILPYFEYVRQSLTEETPPRLFSGTAAFLALFTPHALANIVPDAAPALLFLFMGTVPWLLLPVWFASRRHAPESLRAPVENIAYAALLLLVLGGIVLYAFEIPHGVEFLGIYHFLAPLFLGAALLAGATVDAWIRFDADRIRATLRALRFWAPSAVVLYFVIAPLAVVFDGYANLTVMGDLLILALGALILGGVLLYTLVHPSVRLLGTTASLLAVGSTFFHLSGFVPRTPSALVFPPTPFVASLQQMGARVGGSTSLQQWPLAGNGVPQVFSSSGVMLRRYKRFVEAVNDKPLLVRRMAAPALVLTKDDIRTNLASLRPVLNIQQVFPSGAVLLRYLDALPRARMLYHGRYVDHFRAEDLDPNGPPLVERSNLPEKDSGPVAQATIMAPEHHTEVRIRVGQTRAGALVLADAWYPGWRVLVNGLRNEPFPVDGVFRGVELSEGTHEVIFQYRPESLYWGITFSILGCVFALYHMRYVFPRRRAADDAS